MSLCRGAQGRRLQPSPGVSCRRSWTEADFVYLDSILFCENWSMEDHYMLPKEARTLAGENVRKIKEEKRLETRKGSGGEAQNHGVMAPPDCSSHSLCVRTPPGAGDSLSKEGALSLAGHIRKFFLIRGCFWATLNQLATSTVLARVVNTALRTERALVSLPTPSPVTPSSCNQSPFTDLPYPPWTHPHPLNLWPFLKVRPHSLGSGHFLPEKQPRMTLESFWSPNCCTVGLQRKETAGKARLKILE